MPTYFRTRENRDGSLLWQADLSAKSLHPRVAAHQSKLRQGKRSPQPSRAQLGHASESFQYPLFIAHSCECKGLMKRKLCLLLRDLFRCPAVPATRISIAEITTCGIAIRDASIDFFDEDFNRLLDPSLA